MATFSGIAKTVLVIALAASLSGCADDARPDNNDGQPVASEALITANADAALTKSEVHVGTVPAPAPVPKPAPPVELTPEPVIPPANAPAAQVNAPVNAPAPVKAPAAAAVAPPVAQPAPAPAPKPAAAPVADQAWINATEAKYGVYAPAGTQFVFGPMPASCAGADGCTVYSYKADGVPFNIVITLRPGVLSEYLLFHEIGHSRGIQDECAADNYSRSVIGPVVGHYC